MALTLLVIAAITVIVNRLGPAGPTLTGQAMVVDGDTIRLSETRIRLLGIDAPELDQSCTNAAGAAFPCGVQSRRFLVDLTANKLISCSARGRDRYRRTLANCSVGGTDLARAMVEDGWAVAEPEYLISELSARSAGRGIWAGRFEQPADWRRDHGEHPAGLLEWLESLF